MKVILVSLLPGKTGSDQPGRGGARNVDESSQ